MSDIKNDIQKVEQKVEEGVVETAKKFKEVFSNVASHMPRANLSRNRQKDTYTIEVDLPGVKKEDINVSIEDNYLTVTAERKLAKEVKEDDYYLMESAFGKYTRSFYLPDDIDRDSIDAHYENGRLIITFEKVASKKRRDITVK
ncbi:Hsp20/alpha crystallin family protein [Nitratifractor sp.]|uniref:Hsp20/alpha crystallin family protein n=1 Tax=Nitratifractor sp. TaxID=2268144 RepID=UPI0025E71F8B|nr:Hsp20/alpha crystallin family protein [Nitratifractor sp.]